MDEEIDQEEINKLLLFDYQPYNLHSSNEQKIFQKEKDVLNDEQNRETLIKIQLPSIYMNNTHSIIHQKAFEENQRNSVNSLNIIERKELKRKRPQTPPQQSEMIVFTSFDINPNECEISSFISANE